MSLIIKGMDMPEHCYECLLRQGNCCLLLYEAIPPTVPLTRLDDCPLIEIPTPHGRLIDADALELEKEVELADDWKTAHEIANCVKYAPTIVEAEP